MRELLLNVRWQDHVPGLVRLVSALILLLLALFYHFDQRLALRMSTSQLSYRQQLNDEAAVFQNILRKNLSGYRQYLTRGYIGETRRLQWIEVLKQLGDRYHIPGIEFTIEGSELVEEGSDPFWRPGVAVQVTNMRIGLRLSHEGDLYKLLDGLRKQAPGLFSVESCELNWNTQGEDFILSRLRGECHLRWYTAVDITETWGQEPL